MSVLCFLKDTAPTEIDTYLHTLSLLDALPISAAGDRGDLVEYGERLYLQIAQQLRGGVAGQAIPVGKALIGAKRRSEEHTSELQSIMRKSYAVFCLKKKKDGR